MHLATSAVAKTAINKCVVALWSLCGARNAPMTEIIVHGSPPATAATGLKTRVAAPTMDFFQRLAISISFFKFSWKSWIESCNRFNAVALYQVYPFFQFLSFFRSLVILGFRLVLVYFSWLFIAVALLSPLVFWTQDPKIEKIYKAKKNMWHLLCNKESRDKNGCFIIAGKQHAFLVEAPPSDYFVPVALMARKPSCLPAERGTRRKY